MVSLKYPVTTYQRGNVNTIINVTKTIVMHHLIVYEDGISTTWLNTEILLMCAETVAKHLPHLAAIKIISITIVNPDLATIDAIDILCLNVDYAFTRTCIGGTKLCACFVAQCKKTYKWL